MKNMLFILLCLFISTQPVLVQASAGARLPEVVVPLESVAPKTGKVVLTEGCQAYSIEHKAHTLAKVAAFRDSLTQELKSTGYANSPQGYLIFAYVLAKNPYQGLKNLEGGTINLEKGFPLSKRQKTIMQSFCDNNGQINMDMITR
ncbi:MAG: hypothetical protein AABZ31_04990 [Bdellovibrionota bacterium]